MARSQRKIKITFELEVNPKFLAGHPCTKDWHGLFGQLDRARFHYLIGEQDHTLGKMLEEITRFFLEKDACADAVDDYATNKKLTEEGERLKKELKHYLQENYGLSQRA